MTAHVKHAAEQVEEGAAQHGRHPKRHHGKPSLLRRLAPVAIGVVLGILVMVGFVTGIEWTNRTEFCVSCHSMQQNYKEYKESIHYNNRSGAHAQCADCHVPRDLGPKLVRKFFAYNDVLQEITGTIDTPQKLDAKRAELAERVWAYMSKSDSRECRVCHSYDSMNLQKQGNAGKLKHPQAAMEGKTCINCHKGVAHKLPPRED
jgi:nitrate/TMAO reductase-like tetraheme cytochrome c subunit